MQERCNSSHIRLLHSQYYSHRQQQFVPEAFSLKSRNPLERAISLVNRECACKKDNSICEYIEKRREKFKNATNNPPQFWYIPNKLLLSEICCIKNDSDCHVSLTILPAHKQSEIIFKENNITLLALFRKYFDMKDVYTCRMGTESTFSNQLLVDEQVNIEEDKEKYEIFLSMAKAKSP